MSLVPSRLSTGPWLAVKATFLLVLLPGLLATIAACWYTWLSLQLAPVRAGVDIHLQANRQLWRNLFHSGL